MEDEMDHVPCICAAEFCDHADRERCGKPSEFVIGIAHIGKEGGVGPEMTSGVCEECWARIKKILGF